jgi:hypothetical protein
MGPGHPDPLDRRHCLKGNLMPASTPEQLRSFLKDANRDNPSLHLYDDSLAAWFYDHCTLTELRSAFEGDADQQQCAQWGLNALEWKAQVEMAIIALKANKN